MAAIREDISNQQSRDEFLQGVVLLDQELSGISTPQLRDFLANNNISLQIRGIDQELSTYDLFVFWHVAAMSIPLSPGNAAHSGPIFLPWHRMYLIRFEEELQRVLNNPNFGLPYWDWAQDGEIRPVSNQFQTSLWSDSALGDARGSVRSGQLGNFRVRLDQLRGTLWSIEPRYIRRNAGRDVNSLPTFRDVETSLNEGSYDLSPWDQSVSGHRNRLEGWINGPQLHNRVHVWVGGDMSPGTSPNDPVFFLNHCNVDRIWEAWMVRHARTYRPRPSEGPQGHRIDDLMVAILGDPLTPSDVLEPSTWYSYDSLIVSN